jgi:glycogen operon protein
MILGGDEFARTQGGNNNAYCQDNEISWFDWDRARANAELTAFFRKAIALTVRYPILNRRRFFTGGQVAGGWRPDIAWFGPSLEPPAWNDPEARTIALLLNGAAEASAAGDYLLYLIANADARPQRVLIPAPPAGMEWFRVIDTSLPSGEDFLDAGREVPLGAAEAYVASPLSGAVLLARAPGGVNPSQ